MMRGFTLIELSIVLVIIGLIVGGILVGQDLIKAAETRAQISQIEKYNSAVNTFRGKFGAIPGDMPVSTTNQFGFTTDATTCTGSTGRRDGNGLIDSFNGAGQVQQYGETGLFWQDLSSAPGGNLIEGQFPNGGGAAITCTTPNLAWSTTVGSTYVGDYFPPGKIGHGTYITVYETSGFNWYGLEAITSTNVNALITSSASLPVIQTYNIDKKMDDGIPITGSVLAVYLSGCSNSAPCVPNTAPADTPTTCYNTTNNAYSISSLANYGANGNCALSFRFQ